jgi:hypothetical protein
MTDKRKEHALRLEALENKVFAVVKGVTDKTDPEMLLKVGAPSDEYDPISRRIAEGWVHNGQGRVGETGLAHIIALQWHYSFGDWTKPVPFFSVYFEMAKEMLPLMSWDAPKESGEVEHKDGAKFCRGCCYGSHCLGAESGCECCRPA